MLDGGGGAATLDDDGALRDNKKIIARSLSLAITVVSCRPPESGAARLSIHSFIAPPPLLISIYLY